MSKRFLFILILVFASVAWATKVTLTNRSSSGGGIAGSTGSTDNAILRADGTGGATIQSSTVTIGDTGAIANILGADVVGLKIQQFTGASNPLTEWYNSSSSRRAYVQTSGNIQAAGFQIADNLAAFTNDYIAVPTYTTKMYWGSGSSTPAWKLETTTVGTDFLAMFQINIHKVGNRGLIIEGAGSQTANLTEWRKSDDSVYAQVGATGSMKPGSFTADPCATTVANPPGAIWYNSTSGYLCYCNNSNADKKISDDSDCF